MVNGEFLDADDRERKDVQASLQKEIKGTIQEYKTQKGKLHTDAVTCLQAGQWLYQNDTNPSGG